MIGASYLELHSTIIQITHMMNIIDVFSFFLGIFENGRL
jgi:hypothetical protein